MIPDITPVSHLPRHADRPHRFFLVWPVLLCIVCSSCLHGETSSPVLHTPGGLESQGGHSGVVATSEPVATQIGIRILEQGGNAVDAAAAVAFALNVVEPHSSGVGGGGFMMIYLAGTGKTVIVDSRETAPAAATPTMFLDSQGVPFPFDVRSTSGVAVGVPGMVRGLERALAMWGTRSFADILTPAIALAREGFPITQYLEERIREGLEGGRLSHEPGNPFYDTARSIVAPNGVPLQHPDVLVQTDLARMLELLAKDGPEAFYSGDIARAIVETQQNGRSTPRPEEASRLKGAMTLSDLAAYTAVLRRPVVAPYRGFRIESMPPPSSGGLTVLQMLRMVERFPLGEASRGFGPGSLKTLHVMLEAMRLAFADRAIWMGDADWVPVPVRGLLHDDYIASRAKHIHRAQRIPKAIAGNPLRYDPQATQHITQLQEPVIQTDEGTHTTHFTVTDSQGNIVTYTNTIESEWGTGLMVPGYGFFLNNELTDFNASPTFNADPQHYNPGANDIAPGKRPRSSMAPTIVFRHNLPVAAYGSPGGATIINTVFNMTLNLIDHQMALQEAVDFPRLSQTHSNGHPTLEPGFPLAVFKELRTLGHLVIEARKKSMGSVQAIAIEEVTGLQYGAADHRRPGYVMTLP